jgi:hypothetical protein
MGLEALQVMREQGVSARMDTAASSANLSAIKAPSASRAARSGRSAVTTGKRLHVVRPGDNAWSRRFADILSALISDAGGEANMTEARMQLCRRAATLCIEAEKLEIKSAGGPPSLEEAFQTASGGVKPLDIITEASRILHAVARIKGGNNVRDIAAKPQEELDRVVGLLKDAATIANMAASYGEVDLEIYGQICDRLNRCLRTLGLERRARDVNGFGDAWRADVEQRRIEREAAHDDVE